jgi:hypothetical protein
MKIELISSTNGVNTYCLYDKDGKPIGTKEVILSGYDAGTHYYSLTSKNREEVKRLFNLLNN